MLFHGRYKGLYFTKVCICYFKNYEVPIICYKYNKPIRGAIFNFNKLVSDLDIETCNPDS